MRPMSLSKIHISFLFVCSILDRISLPSWTSLCILTKLKINSLRSTYLSFPRACIKGMHHHAQKDIHLLLKKFQKFLERINAFCNFLNNIVSHQFMPAMLLPYSYRKFLSCNEGTQGIHRKHNNEYLTHRKQKVDQLIFVQIHTQKKIVK